MTQTCTPLEAAARRACCKRLLGALDVRLFRALGESGRADMLARLSGCRRACTVGEIAACCPIDVSVVSRHLAALRDAGVVCAEKRGREVYYRVEAASLAARLRSLADAIDDCPCAESTLPRPRAGNPDRKP